MTAFGRATVRAGTKAQASTTTIMAATNHQIVPVTDRKGVPLTWHVT
jgi:hypothetical protein